MSISTPIPVEILHSVLSGPAWGAGFNFLRDGSGGSNTSTVRWAEHLTYIIGADNSSSFTVGAAAVEWTDDVAGVPEAPTITHIPIGTTAVYGAGELRVGRITDTYFDVLWGGSSNSPQTYNGRRCFPQPDGSLSLGPLATCTLSPGTGPSGLGMGYVSDDDVACCAAGFLDDFHSGVLNLATGGSTGETVTALTDVFDVPFGFGEYSILTIPGGQAGTAQAAFGAIVVHSVTDAIEFAGVMTMSGGGVGLGASVPVAGAVGSGGGNALYAGPDSNMVIGLGSVTYRLVGSTVVPMSEFYPPPHRAGPDEDDAFLEQVLNTFDSSRYAGWGSGAGEVAPFVYREHSYGPDPIPFAYGWVPADSFGALVQPLTSTDYDYFIDWTGALPGDPRLVRIWAPAPQLWRVGSIGSG